MDESYDFSPLRVPAPASGRRFRGEQGRCPNDGLRLWSALTHGAGLVLSLIGAVFLLVRALSTGRELTVVALAVYAGTMALLYAASTLYHSLPLTDGGRIALRKFDHASIYCLIAGSYTPICLLALRGARGWALFGVSWGLALAGMVLSLVWIMAPRWVTAGLYLFMGWIAIFAFGPLMAALPTEGLIWLFTGGVLYTTGGILYAVKWPGRDNRRFGCHEIFHIFIVLGSLCLFFLMYRVVVFL